MNIVWIAVRYMTIRGLLFGVVLGALYGSLFGLLGTLYGALFGGVVGLLTGFFGGLHAGMLTLFHPLTNVLSYQRTLILSCAIFTSIATYLGFSWLMGTAYFAITLPPAFIAALASIYITLGFADRYVSGSFEKPKRKREDVYA